MLPNNWVRPCQRGVFTQTVSWMTDGGGRVTQHQRSETWRQCQSPHLSGRKQKVVILGQKVSVAGLWEGGENYARHWDTDPCWVWWPLRLVWKCPLAETCPQWESLSQPGTHPHKLPRTQSAVWSGNPTRDGKPGHFTDPNNLENKATVVFTHTFRDTHPFKSQVPLV